MSRYIDAQKLKDAMNIEEDTNGYFNIMTALKCVDDAPTADVQEVRHGHWIFSGDYTSTCSYCNDDVDVDHEKEPKYCPNCGAKMDEEEKQQ